MECPTRTTDLGALSDLPYLLRMWSTHAAA